MITGRDCTGVAVAFFCHDGKKSFVLHKRSTKTRGGFGQWDFGGGKLEFGETIKDGLLRELDEEYGCLGKIEQQLPSNSFVRKERGRVVVHWVSIPFIIKVNRSDVKLNEPRSMDELAWFQFSNLPNPLHTPAEEYIKKFPQYFEKYR